MRPHLTPFRLFPPLPCFSGYSAWIYQAAGPYIANPDRDSYKKGAGVKKVVKNTPDGSRSTEKYDELPAGPSSHETAEPGGWPQ